MGTAGPISHSFIRTIVEEKFVDNTDQETVESLKRWFNQYGTPIIAGIVIAGLLFGGFRFYNNSVEQKNRAASASYEQLVQLLEDSDRDAAQIRGQIASLLNDHPGTSYAGFAHLFLASLEVESANYAEALASLELARSLLSQPSMQELIDLRRARVLFELGNDRQALALLDSAESSTQAAQKLELKGDILSSQGLFADARAAYQAALEPAALIEGRLGFLNLKINNIPADQ